MGDVHPQRGSGTRRYCVCWRAMRLVMGDQMTTLQRRAGWATVVFLPPLIVVALVLNLLPDPRIGGPIPHVYVVTLTAGLLAVLALLMAVASAQVRDMRAFFLAVTFLSISGIFVAHSLTTPTALIP